MTQHILEESKVKVRARICDGKATTTNVTFIFFKDGTELERKPAELPSTESLGDSGWVEAEVTAPEVEAEKKNYELSYHVELADRKITDLPAYTVWPSKGKVTVTPATAEHDDMVGFRFRVTQNGEVQGEETKRVIETDGTYEFELIAGHAFTLEALPPYEITEWTKQEGHEVECKATMKFEADFFAPQKGPRKQYVNVAPANASAADVGRDQKGPTIVVKMGVKGDLDRADDDKFGKQGLVIHFRATYGPKVGNGGIEKSTRADPGNKTEIKQELEVTEVAASESDTVYKGKLEMKADGTAELKAYLGLAGGDVCTIEIAGSDTFLTDASIAADATLTLTNWRKSFYELLAVDFYDLRELAEVDVAGVKHRDYPPAAITKLKALGDSVFIEYEWVKTHLFAPDKASTGTVLPRKFLEIGAAGDGYMLTDYTMTLMPTGVTWDKTKVDQTNYIKLCDANYYFERAGASFPYNLSRMRIEATAVNPKFTVTVTHGGYYIPVSGNGPRRGGTGATSIFTPAGAAGIAWEAKVDPANYKTTVDAITDNRAGAQPSDTKTITVTETNQNPAACAVVFTKGSTGIGNVGTSVSATDKTRIEGWVQAMFTPAKLKANNNKISVTISGEPGASRKQTRFDAVKTIVQAKLNALKGTHSISVHPGLDDAGQPRKGTLALATVDMANSTRKECVLALPAATATDPGSFVGAVSTTKCPIKLDMYIESHSEALGLCQQADVLACFSKANAAVDVCVTMHELGHSYNQTIYSASDKPPKGMTKPKNYTQAETENRYKNNGAKGHMYDAHGHSGSHCAYGLSDADKAAARYTGKGASAACVMFGAGGYNRNFCPLCVDYIRGANLTKVPAVTE